MTERFEIDVEGTTQENALFQGDEFLCYADDVEAIIEKLNELNDENERLKQYKQAVNDVLDSYYQKDLSPIEEILVGGIARELNLDLHYKPKKGDAK